MSLVLIMEKFLSRDWYRKQHKVNTRFDLDRAGVSNRVRALVASLGIVFPRFEIPTTLIAEQLPKPATKEKHELFETPLPVVEARETFARGVENIGYVKAGEKPEKANADSAENAEQNKHFKIPVEAISKIKGSVVNLKARRDWPSNIRNMYNLLNELGISAVLIKVNSKQTKLAIAVPDEYLDEVNAEIKIPEKEMAKLEAVRMKGKSKEILDSLAYFYWLCRRDLTKKRKQGRKMRNKRRDGVRERARTRKNKMNEWQQFDDIDDEAVEKATEEIDEINLYNDLMDRLRKASRGFAPDYRDSAHDFDEVWDDYLFEESEVIEEMCGDDENLRGKMIEILRAQVLQTERDLKREKEYEYENDTCNLLDEAEEEVGVSAYL